MLFQMSKFEAPHRDVIHLLDQINVKEGLGTDLYEAVSRLTPSISVEAVVKNSDASKTLLIWRNDKMYGPGWHLPGGVLRFKETLKDRLFKTLDRELGITKADITGPLGFHEIFNEKRDVRGHFISFVFEVIPHDPPSEKKQSGVKPSHGCWRWFETCPPNLIVNQAAFRKYLK